MPQIGIRELKTKASQLVRNIRKRKTRYVVTLRGRPVALLTPLEEPPAALPPQTQTQNTWDELTRLGKLMAKSGASQAHSSDVLSDMRR